MKTNLELLGHECPDTYCNILIIDKDKDFSAALKNVLLKDRHTVIQVYSMQEAKAFLQKIVFDYVILDLQLSEGQEEELIEFLPKKMKVKMIILATDEDVQRREYLFSLGILDYFFKNTPMPLMLTNIRELICKVELNHFSNILIVDESSFSRKILTTLLRRRGYKTFAAKSAEEGLTLLKQAKMDLVLLAYELPDMNGIEALSLIKKDDAFLELPVIVLSANDDKDIVSRSLKLGAIDFIRKPFINEELLLKCDFHTANYKNTQVLKLQGKELEKSIAQMKEIEKQKSQFLANMSHEIRTPLNAIIGFIELLKEEDTGRKSLEYINIIDNASETLLHIIEDILDLAKIESGKLNIENIDFSPRKEFENVMHLFKAQCSEKNITLITNIDKNLPEIVNSDALRIKQVISNLLSNAIKFTPNGKKIKVHISYENNRLHVSVKDEGRGIAKERLSDIFEAFTQEDISTTRNYGGTGLGLTISNELVHLLGGKLNVKSEMNQGSEFSFWVPVTIGTKTIEKPLVTESLKFKNKRVLLAEDNKSNQIFMSVLFEKLSMSFDIVSNGKEAVEMFQKKHYDAIFMDENMPQMGGIEATQKIIAIEKAQAKEHTPIIALTANALQGDREKFLAAGMDEYLTKPIRKNEITVLLNEIFSAKEEIKN